MLFQYLDVCDKDVLDVGCGCGGISMAFAERGARVMGIDYDSSCISTAKLKAKNHKPEIKFILNNAEDIKLPDSSFDIIVCNAVFEHVFNPEKVASEIGRLLKYEGFFFLDTPNRYSILQLISDTHYNLFGISIMPRWMAAFYTVRIRKRYYKYDVADLRTCGYIKKIFAKNKIVFLEDANIKFLIKQIIGELPLPESGLRNKIIIIFDRLHLSWLLEAFIKSSFYRYFITSGWALIGIKI